MKKCNKCGELKEESEYYKGKSKCKKCISVEGIKRRKKAPHKSREKNLKQRYGISIDEYNTMFIEQRGLCDICGNPESDTDHKGKVKYLAVDHNHKTGKVRGLLCSQCNTALGKFRDSKELLFNAINYLEVNNE